MTARVCSGAGVLRPSEFLYSSHQFPPLSSIYSLSPPPGPANTNTRQNKTTSRGSNTAVNSLSFKESTHGCAYKAKVGGEPYSFV